jgi:hypothetical protein
MVNGDTGITTQKQDDAGLVVFIPDRGRGRMTLRMRSKGEQNGMDLSKMTQIE